jgi:hypothetical protein
MGPFSRSGSYNFDLWAGAGQCLISNAKFAGTGTVTFTSGTTATITLRPTGTITQLHAYIGTQKLVGGPDDYQTAPGQYPFKKDPISITSPTTYTYTPSIPSSGNVYIVVHVKTSVC